MENFIFQYGLPGVIAFGGVGVIDFIVKKHWKKEMDKEVKFALLVVLFFLALFIPVEFANDILNKVKIAVAGALAIHAFWTIRKA